MKKFLLLAVVMFASLTASAQQKVGTFSVIPKVGFNLANLAGDVEGNSMKFGLVAGGDVMYQVTPTIGVSGGAFYSMQGCEGEGDTSFSLGEINIPLLANFYVAPNLALKTGLQPGIIASAIAFLTPLDTAFTIWSLFATAVFMMSQVLAKPLRYLFHLVFPMRFPTLSSMPAITSVCPRLIRIAEVSATASFR